MWGGVALCNAILSEKEMEKRRALPTKRQMRRVDARVGAGRSRLAAKRRQSGVRDRRWSKNRALLADPGLVIWVGNVRGNALESDHVGVPELPQDLDLPQPCDREAVLGPDRQTNRQTDRRTDTQTTQHTIA